MKRKGYIYGLLVFLIFVSVFLVAITNMKSVSVMQESNYDKITMMKISRAVENIKTVWPDIGPPPPADDQARCANLRTEISSYADELPFDISVDCNPPAGPMYVRVMSKSGRYNNTIEL